LTSKRTLLVSSRSAQLQSQTSHATKIHHPRLVGGLEIDFDSFDTTGLTPRTSILNFTDLWQLCFGMRLAHPPRRREARCGRQSDLNLNLSQISWLLLRQSRKTDGRAAVLRAVFGLLRVRVKMCTICSTVNPRVAPDLARFVERSQEPRECVPCIPQSGRDLRPRQA